MQCIYNQRTNGQRWLPKNKQSPFLKRKPEQISPEDRTKPHIFAF